MSTKVTGSLPTAEVPFSEIDPLFYPNVRQTPRKAEEKNELRASIKKRGLLQPIIVTKKTAEDVALQVAGDKKGDPTKPYALVAGYGRYECADDLRVESSGKLFTNIVVALFEGDEEAVQDIQAVENIHREDLPETDKVRAINAMIKDGFKAGQIARRWGKSVSWVNHRIQFQEHAAPALQQAVNDGTLGFAAGYNVMAELGGAKATKEQLEGQEAVAKAAVQGSMEALEKHEEEKLQAEEERAAKVEEEKKAVAETGKKKQGRPTNPELPDKVADLSEHKRKVAAGKAANEELKIQQEKTNTKSSKATVGQQKQSSVVAIMTIIKKVNASTLKRTPADENFDKGVLAALQWVSGSKGAPDLLEDYETVKKDFQDYLRKENDKQSKAQAATDKDVAASLTKAITGDDEDQDTAGQVS